MPNLVIWCQGACINTLKPSTLLFYFYFAHYSYPFKYISNHEDNLRQPQTVPEKKDGIAVRTKAENKEVKNAGRGRTKAGNKEVKNSGRGRS